MKERLVTLGLAVCALALFWFFFFPKPAGVATTPRPMSAGTDGEGYAAAARWLAKSGIGTTVLHKRFDNTGAGSLDAEGTGNLLVTTFPYAVALNSEEFSQLDRWIARGNTLLILAGLDDTPLWSATSANFVPDVQKIARIELTAVEAPGKDPIAKARAGILAMTLEGGATRLRPNGRIAMLQGVVELATLTPLPSEQWRAKAMDSSPVLELAHRADSNDGALWLKSSGQGAIILSAYASLFSNGVIGKADNARLLSNIVAWSLTPGGKVIFDDAHQGDLDEYDAAKLYSDPRLHHTLLWLLALWLVWVLATQPLRASQPPADSLDEAAMLRTTAKFFAGVLRPVASAQWLLDEFFGRLRRRHGLGSSTSPPWAWLAAQAGVSGALLEELRDLYARTQAGERVKLLRLQQVLSQIAGHTS